MLNQATGNVLYRNVTLTFLRIMNGLLIVQLYKTGESQDWPCCFLLSLDFQLTQKPTFKCCRHAVMLRTLCSLKENEVLRHSIQILLYEITTF